MANRAVCVLVVVVGCAVARAPQGEFELLVPSGAARNVEVLRRGVFAEDCRYQSSNAMDAFPSVERVVEQMLAQARPGNAIQNLELEYSQQYRFFNYACYRARGDVVLLSARDDTPLDVGSGASAGEGTLSVPSIASSDRELSREQAMRACLNGRLRRDTPPADERALSCYVRWSVAVCNAEAQLQVFRAEMDALNDRFSGLIPEVERLERSRPLLSEAREELRGRQARADAEYQICMDQVGDRDR